MQHGAADRTEDVIKIYFVRNTFIFTIIITKIRTQNVLFSNRFSNTIYYNLKHICIKRMKIIVSKMIENIALCLTLELVTWFTIHGYHNSLLKHHFNNVLLIIQCSCVECLEAVKFLFILSLY